jgi:predicted nucleic acid-binding protein
MADKQKIVVDSSVIIKWLSKQDEKYIKNADKLLKNVQNKKIDIYAPELSKYEVANALLKGKALDIKKARAALTAFYNLPIYFIPENKQIAQNAYAIALKQNITYYDASFIALARDLEASLVTDNIKHQGKISLIKIIPLPKY